MMNQVKDCFSVLALFLFSAFSFGQEVTSNNSGEFKPFFGVGIGTFAYYGDISPVDFGYEPIVSDIGYRFCITNNLVKGVDLSLEATFGKLTGNVRTLKRNLNFQSEIRSGGINLSYDFSHFLSEQWTLKPYLTVGFTSFEFLSKTDLFDADGNMYHYWKDGTIRNISENDPNAEGALFLFRDYEYETDLRELNLDELGDYDQQSFAIPVGAGVKFDLTPSLKFQIQSQYYYAQTDLIDNISDQGQGSRKGGDKNDGFLFNSATLFVHFPKKNKLPGEKMDIDKELLASIDRADEDKDGIGDMIDKCPFTPNGVNVDNDGCPIDNDGDGVPDYKDLENDTPFGAEVDTSGVLLSEDYFAEKYYFFIDTLSGGPNIVKNRVESASIEIQEKPRPPRKTVYGVQVGNSEQGISNEMAQTILSIPDVRSILREDTAMIMVGSYDQLIDAVRRKIKLKDEGIEGTVYSDGEDGLVDMSAQSASLESSVAETMASFKGTIWRVQIGAFKNGLSANVFSNVPDVVEIKGDDGLIRYTSGAFKSLEEAANHKINLLLKGFVGSFITVYRDGQLISLAEAGIKNANSGETKSPGEQWDQISTNSFNKDLISYSVLLTSIEGEMRTETLNNFLQIGGVTQMRYDGNVFYLFENFSTAASAQESVDVVRDRFPEAKVVGLFDGKLISKEEAEAMFKN